MRNNHMLRVVFIAVFTLGIMWLPFIIHANSFFGVDFNRVGMDRIAQNFDGLNFLIVAKTGYNPSIIQQNYQDILVDRRPLYFSAHYPVFPILIWLINFITSGPNALLIVIIISNALLGYALYSFFLLFSNKPNVATWLAIIALFFPARILSDRIVGSNEPLFIFFVLMSLVFSTKKQHWLSAIYGSLAVLTRSPGIILFGAYIIHTWIMSSDTFYEKIKISIPYLMIPISLLGLWMFYGIQFGSFWAYFQVGGNINLYWPFAVFASHMDWVSGIWNEDLIYLFILLISGLFLFWQKNVKSQAAIFGILYGIFVLSVAHRDLARYSLPIIPIVLVGLAPLLEYKLVRLVSVIMIIPIMLYSWQFVLANYQPIVNWAPFL